MSFNKTETDKEIETWVHEHRKGFYGSAAVLGAVVTIAWLVLAGVMAVVLGAWGWVVWPAVVFLTLKRITVSILQYGKMVEPKKEDFAPIVVNVHGASGMSESQIADMVKVKVANHLNL